MMLICSRRSFGEKERVFGILEWHNVLAFLSVLGRSYKVALLRLILLLSQSNLV